MTSPSSDPLTPGAAGAPAGPGALAGLKIVDLSRVLGGPYCTQILGDHGADVVKVEPPTGDETRSWGPPFVEGTSAYYQGVNRNKRGIVLDLSGPEGRARLTEMLKGADILVENFKPGTLEKWGLGIDVLAERFPRLIHCRVSGFGADGPLGGFAGYDAAIQAVTGLMSVNGDATGEPTRVGVPVVDMVTGLNAVVGILLAVAERHRSGRGQFVEAALYDCGLSLQHPHAANYLASGRVPGRSGNAHPNIAPYDSFRTGTSPIFLAVGNDGQFARLCAILGLPDAPSDPRFRTNPERCRHRDALKELLEGAMTARAGEDLFEILMRDSVPCGPVLDVDAALAHPHARHRGMLVEMEGYRGIGAPVKLARTPATYRRPPPALGADQHELFPT